MLFSYVSFVRAGSSQELKRERDARKEEKEGYKNFKTQKRLLYEKMIKRTKECRDFLDDLFFTVNSHARKAVEEKNVKKEKEFIAVLSDYNSVLGDLGLMQVMLDFGKFAEGKNFMEYYMLMETGYEMLKRGFSLKNEVFLNRIDTLTDEDALRYEKKLLRLYREYLEYDPKLDKIEEIKDEVNQERG